MIRSGDRFGELTAIARYGIDPRQWSFVCDCGREVTRFYPSLERMRRLGMHSCCATCRCELRDGKKRVSIATRDYYRTRIWNTTKSLYSAQSIEGMCRDVLDALVSEFGPVKETVPRATYEWTPAEHYGTKKKKDEERDDGAYLYAEAQKQIRETHEFFGRYVQ